MSINYVNLSKVLDLPYSTATIAGNYVFVSGQIGHVDENGKTLTTIEEQTTQVLEKIKKVLGEIGCSLKDVVKSTIFLADSKLFGQVNEIYKKYFKAPAPARSTIIAGMILPEILVEIEIIAYKNS
ncbi:MAG: RidA family protein [Chloroflexi bacterium]|nr:RidA family protein [Chloroflexota bacterium]